MAMKMHEMIAQLCEDKSSRFYLDSVKTEKIELNSCIGLFYSRRAVTDMVSDETVENVQLS